MREPVADRVLDTLSADCVVVATLPCPFCGRSDVLGLTEDQVQRLIAGEPVHDVLTEYPAAVREQFVSGIDADCWDWHVGMSPVDFS